MTLNLYSEPTLVAVRLDTGEHLTLGDYPPEQLRALSDAQLLACPFCGGGLQLKAGKVRMHHFAHLNTDLCSAANHEPETESHQRGKMLLYQHFRTGATIADLEHHFMATGQRADVYIETTRRYAFEFQQASITADRWLNRHLLYREQGITDIWILGMVRYHEAEPPKPISPFDPLPLPRSEFDAAAGTFRIRELEKAMLAHSPILTYLDPATALLTILACREVRHNRVRAYRYRLLLGDCRLSEDGLWSPLTAALAELQRLRRTPLV